MHYLSILEKESEILLSSSSLIILNHSIQAFDDFSRQYYVFLSLFLVCSSFGVMSMHISSLKTPRVMHQLRSMLILCWLVLPLCSKFNHNRCPLNPHEYRSRLDSWLCGGCSHSPFSWVPDLFEAAYGISVELNVLTNWSTED